MYAPAEIARCLLEDDYTPSPEHIAWMQQQYMLMRHGGIWAVPGSRSIWEIDKVRKAYVLKEGDPNHPLNQRIKLAAEAAGFNVILGNEGHQAFGA